MQAFSSCAELDGVITAVDSPVTEHRLWGMWASVVAERVCMGLIAPWYVESSQTRDQTGVPCIGRCILFFFFFLNFILFLNFT